MNARDRLRMIVDAQQGRLAAGEFPDREAALLALVGQIDRVTPPAPATMAGPCLGASTALRLCLHAAGTGDAADGARRWAEDFLTACRATEAARLVLRFADAGEMRLAVDRSGAFEARLAGDRVPSLWRERAAIAAWAVSTARTAANDDRDSGDPARLARIAWQLPYPADGTIGSVPVSVLPEALVVLIGLAGQLGGRGDAQAAIDEHELVAKLSARLGLEPQAASDVVSALTLDAENAGWHAVLPDGPLAPLVRLGPHRLALIRRALATEPLFFLARELRRRDPKRYHNGAHQRERAFRDDLYARFAERRYVTAADRILLRRDDRQNRTDIDAAVFDRKTGTLALFELKAQDAFARTVDELERQRENLGRAGRQVAATLDWIHRNGADDVLNRMDRSTAKRFRVQRVLPFVLGRYSADPVGRSNGRVAWGSWGQVVRLLDGATGGNPLLSLHAALVAGERADASEGGIPLPGRIVLDETCISVGGSQEM